MKPNAGGLLGQSPVPKVGRTRSRHVVVELRFVPAGFDDTVIVMKLNGSEGLSHDYLLEFLGR